MVNYDASDLPTKSSQRAYLITECIISSSLVLYALFAPHSIAVTQGTFLLGLLAWGVQLAITRRFRQRRTPVDIAIFGFFACCVISSFLSYDPVVSIKGLRSPALFFAFYLVAHKIRSLHFATTLVFLLVASCLINVAYSAGQIAVGRGLRIDSIKQGTPFAKKGLSVGDVILEADGQKVKTEEDLLSIIDSGRGRLRVNYQRNEMLNEASISRRTIAKSPGIGAERLGITTSPGRSFRVSGFYSHYETYAEVLQLIAALAVGMLIARPNKRSATTIFLALSVLAMTATLIMTSTRAAMLGLALAVAAMAIASARRGILVVSMLGIILLAPLALYSLQRTRGISLLDPEEGSTMYRLAVWREALFLIKENPLVGIGKGSEGKLKETLGLYDNGRLPPGHFHSTPVQIAVWWGLPALVLYFSFMTILFVEAWKLSKTARAQEQFNTWGLALGGVGGLVAFNMSSLVHFNFGDGEVVMALWLLTGIVFAARRITLERFAGTRPGHIPTPPLTSSSDKSQPQAQEVISELSARAAKARQNL